MLRCPSCGKIIFKKTRYCPSCNTDLWEAEADSRMDDPSALMEEAYLLFQRGDEDKAGVWASRAITAIMNDGENVSFARLRRAVRELAGIYEGESEPVADETMIDALDYLEERAEASGDERYLDETAALRDRVSKLNPDAAPVTEQSLDLAWQRDYWKLPLPESVTDTPDYAGFVPDLTQTHGLSLTEMAFFQYLQFGRVSSVMEGMTGDDTGYLDAVFPADTVTPQQAGPAAEVLKLLMSSLSPAGYAALKRLYRRENPDGWSADLGTLRSVCQAAAQQVGLFPEELFFTALVTPLLSMPGSYGSEAYSAAEPGIRRILNLSSCCREGNFSFLHPAAEEEVTAEPEFVSAPSGQLAEAETLHVEDGGELRLPHPSEIVEAGTAEEEALAEESAGQAAAEDRPADAPSEAEQKKSGEEQRREDEAYCRQLLQTFTSEYCVMYGILEYQAAEEYRQSKRELYKQLLSQAAANGLSIACRDEARNWFSADNGYESDPGFAKYYTQILSMRGLNYKIVSYVAELKGVEMKVPGIGDGE
ncbi:MAG: hypothetical protein ACOX8B_05440 [Lachnospiraceae bacterium]|jgi:hypothetical protein